MKLAQALLCCSCAEILEAPAAQCPSCTSRVLFPIARWLSRPTTESRPERETKYDPKCIAYNQETRTWEIRGPQMDWKPLESQPRTLDVQYIVKRGVSMTMQTMCTNGWIHRRQHRKHLQLQCPACGKKIDITPDEQHEDIEAQHGRECRIRNSRSTPAEEMSG